MWVDVVQLRGYGNDSNRVDKKGLLLTGQSFAIAICHFVPGPDLASTTTTKPRTGPPEGVCDATITWEVG
jgi:hypothetical protein